MMYLFPQFRIKNNINEDLGGDGLDDNQNNDATTSKKHKFRWQKKDT